MIVHDCARFYIYELTAAAVPACQCHHPWHSTMFMYGRLLSTSGTQRNANSVQLVHTLSSGVATITGAHPQRRPKFTVVLVNTAQDRKLEMGMNSNLEHCTYDQTWEGYPYLTLYGWSMCHLTAITHIFLTLGSAESI